jgi:hypothetical protein
MANIKLVINPILVPNHVVVVVERVSALGAEVTRQAFAPPHTQRNVTFPDLDPVMYRFFFWESADGVALDTLLGSADIDGSLAFDYVIEIFEIVVDGPGPNDPAAGTDEYNNADLAGCELLTPGVTPAGPVITVFQRAVGPKLSTEVEALATGGFKHINGDQFYNGDVWIVFKYSKILAPTVTSTTVWPADIETIVEAVTALTSVDHFNKMLEIFSAHTVQTLAFPDLATVADKKYLIINTQRFTGNYLTLDMSAGGGLWFNGALLDVFWMPAGEELILTIKGGELRVVNYTGATRRRGQIVSDYMVRPGTVQAIGTEYTKADMPGLYDWVEDLPGGAAVSFAQWASTQTINGTLVSPYKGCYAIDPGTEKIKVPDLRNRHTRYLKLAADTERVVNLPGGYQHEKVGYIDLQVRDGFGGSSTGSISNTGLSGQDNPGPFIDNDLAAGAGTEKYIKSLGLETRPSNVGLIPLITL